MPQPPSEWTVLSMLEWATSYFEEKEIRNPRFSIEWLLAYVLDIRRLDLYLKYDRPLNKEELAQLRPLIKRRATHEPLQYITGETDFFNVKIKVRPGVLIPRMETEQLVEIILSEFNQETSLKVVDLGTGSGCIPIALKSERPAWNISATDVSEEALAVAQENAELNGTDIDFHKDDIFSPSNELHSGGYHLIVSNPPYILSEEEPSLDEEVKNYEPSLALFCDSTQKMYSSILKFADQFLLKKGTLFLELHENHAEEVLGIFSDQNWDAAIHRDYDNKERFLIARKS